MSTYTRREAIGMGLAGLGSAALASAQEQGPAGEQPLNVLFINTDQQRFDALSCAGNPYVSTPNLDRLAHEGVRFTRAYTPLPMCVPARASFHTGRTVCNTGCVSLPEGDFDFGAGSYDQNLAPHGYRTEYQGRWHAPLELTACYENDVTLNFNRPYKEQLRETLGEPPEPGAGQEVGLLAGWPYDPDPHDPRRAGLWPDKPAYRDVLIAGETDLPAEHSYTAYVADQTIDALRRLKDGPFSLTSAYLAPHHPWTVPDRFAHSPKPEDMPTPETLNHGRENTPWTNSFWDLPQPYRDNMGVFQARYYQLLQEADYHIGRVLNALEELGLAENTLVIFCADHGEMLGDHGLTQKFVPYDASVRIPMMMRLPGAIGAGTTVEHPVNSLDIFATIFDYLGLPCPEQDGLSLRPLIEGRSSDYPDFGFSEWGGPNGWLMFADSDWKYVWTRQPEAVDCLFDLRNDPMELNNLLGANPRRADYLPQAQRVKDHMLAWMDRIGHPYRQQLAEAEIA